MNKEESFKDWYNPFMDGLNGTKFESIKHTWRYQQQKIDALEKQLAEKDKQLERALVILREIDEYLSETDKEKIWSKSLFHREIAEYLEQFKESE